MATPPRPSLWWLILHDYRYTIGALIVLVIIWAGFYPEAFHRLWTNIANFFLQLAIIIGILAFVGILLRKAFKGK